MILEKFDGNNRITAEELVETVGINLRNIKQNIYKLKSKGLIQRIGPDKGGYWKVIIPINRNVTSSIDN
jgi:predicted HTH transcriptional regulator